MDRVLLPERQAPHAWTDAEDPYPVRRRALSALLVFLTALVFFCVLLAAAWVSWVSTHHPATDAERAGER